jgi:hypothetical protein
MDMGSTGDDLEKWDFAFPAIAIGIRLNSRFLIQMPLDAAMGYLAVTLSPRVCGGRRLREQRRL